jgi:hypothetical protein
MTWAYILRVIAGSLWPSVTLEHFDVVAERQSHRSDRMTQIMESNTPYAALRDCP